jgi:hypothetical protein
MSEKKSALNFVEAEHERRQFLRVGGLSFLGITLSDYFRMKETLAAVGKGIPTKAQSVILIWLSGGPPHMDMWDPKPNSNFKPIGTNVAGIQISETLPKTAQHMDKLSIIRSMHTEENNHPEGTYYGMTGHRPNPAFRFPSFGSIVSRELGGQNNVPPYVVTPPLSYDHSYMAGNMGPQYNPMIVPDPSQEDFKIPDLTLPKSLSAELIQDRQTFLKVVDHQFRQKEKFARFNKMDSYQEQALRMILSPNVKKAFDLSEESDKVKESYGKTRFGQSVLLARRLVESGCRFVTAEGFNHSEWDIHFDNDKLLKENLAPRFDQAMSTLLTELDERGLLESTVVLAMGEFGRTPNINPRAGRDHWCHCWSMVLGGGGIKGGQIVGASDERAAYVAERKVTQGDLFATVYKALGIDWTKTYTGLDGRPLYIANSIGDKQGNPVHELI